MRFQFVKSNGGSRLSRVLVVATLLGLLTLALVLAQPAHVVKAQSGCTNATLDGSYGFLLRQFFLPHQGAPVGRALVSAGTGIQIFDGMGNTSGSQTDNAHPAPSRISY